MNNYRRSPFGGMGGRSGFNRGTLIIGLIFAAISLIKYFASSSLNEITGETQHITLSVDQEIALGVQSTPTMIQQHGGLHPDLQRQALVREVGNILVNSSAVRLSGYKFDFHLLADERTVNAFALPGGQVFITAALANQLENEDQLAGVLGHEIGHVVARHGAERLAKQQLTQGLTGAAVIAAGDYSTAQAAQMIAGMINMKYGREQELESDDLGVRFMLKAGYDPKEMLGVMRILKKASGGGSKQPEFFSTHPDPENRAEEILESIEKYKNAHG